MAVVLLGLGGGEGQFRCVILLLDNPPRPKHSHSSLALRVLHGCQRCGVGWLANRRRPVLGRREFGPWLPLGLSFSLYPGPLSAGLAFVFQSVIPLCVRILIVRSFHYA